VILPPTAGVVEGSIKIFLDRLGISFLRLP
jgi:hypothetical protein